MDKHRGPSQRKSGSRLGSFVSSHLIIVVDLFTVADPVCVVDLRLIGTGATTFFVVTNGRTVA